MRTWRMPATHYAPPDQVHFTWDAGHAPSLTIADGDTVVFHTRDVSDNQIGPDSDSSVVAGMDWDRVYPLAGPVSSRAPSPATRSRWRSSTCTRRAGDGPRSSRARPAGRRVPGPVPAGLRHLQRRRRAVPRGHRDPAHAVPRDDGRLPGRRERSAGHAARDLRRQHGHPPARRRHDAVPPGARRGRAVLLRRRARLPGRRRGLRHRPRGADVQRAALQRPVRPLDPGALSSDLGP